MEYRRKRRYYDFRNLPALRLTVVISVIIVLIMTAVYLIGGGEMPHLFDANDTMTDYYLAQLSLTFITITVMSILSDKPVQIYWIDLVYEKLIEPKYMCFYALVSYSFATCIINVFSLLYGFTSVFIFFFMFNVITLMALSFSMLSVYFKQDNRLVSAQYEYLDVICNDEKLSQHVRNTLQEHTVTAIINNELSTVKENCEFYGTYLEPRDYSFLYNMEYSVSSELARNTVTAAALNRYYKTIKLQDLADSELNQLDKLYKKMYTDPVKNMIQLFDQLPDEYLVRLASASDSYLFLSLVRYLDEQLCTRIRYKGSHNYEKYMPRERSYLYSYDVIGCLGESRLLSEIYPKLVGTENMEAIAHSILNPLEPEICAVMRLIKATLVANNTELFISVINTLRLFPVAYFVDKGSDPFVEGGGNDLWRAAYRGHMDAVILDLRGDVSDWLKRRLDETVAKGRLLYPEISLNLALGCEMMGVDYEDNGEENGYADLLETLWFAYNAG